MVLRGGVTMLHGVAWRGKAVLQGVMLCYMFYIEGQLLVLHEG